MKNEAYKDMASRGDCITSLSMGAYDTMVKKASPPTTVLRNCLMAFLFGGGICALGEGFFFLYTNVLTMTEKDGRSAVSMTLITLTAILTALKRFDNIAKLAGAGTIVPITGFANAVVSPAIEFKSEGYVLGVGAKIFSIAGPVLVYGITASVIYGLVLFLVGLVV